MRLVICILLTFCYIYPPNFIFLPVPFRWVYSTIGLVCLVLDFDKIKLEIIEKKNWKKLTMACVLLLLFATVSSFINAYYDSYFFKIPVQVILSLTAAYGYISLVRIICSLELTNSSYMQYYVYAALLQCIIAVVFFLFPTIQAAANSLLNMSELAEEHIKRNIEIRVRLMGFSSGFFTAGTVNAICLFYIAMLLNKKTANKLFNIIAIVLVVLIGSGMARTTSIGLIMFVAYFILKREGSFFKKLMVTAIIAGVGIFCFSFFVEKFENNAVFGDVFYRGFQLYYELTGQSTTDITYSYTTADHYPPFEEIKTWIIGDAKMADPRNPLMAYYKGVDIGFSRTIYCIGLLGLLAYSLIQYRMCKMIPDFSKLESLMLFGIFLILMAKGIYALDTVTAPFIMASIYNRCHPYRPIGKRKLLTNKF